LGFIGDVSFFGGGAGGGGGGSGGVSDYSGLTGKPRINNVALASGNNTLDALKLSYTHTQPAPSTSWVIAHNLGYKLVSVSCIDDDGDTLFGDIDRIDDDNLTISFYEPVSGLAIIRR
jgi:hypothetical protein